MLTNKICRLFLLVDCLVVLFYSISTFFGSFNAELNYKQFNLVLIYFCLHSVKCQKQFYFKQ